MGLGLLLLHLDRTGSLTVSFSHTGNGGVGDASDFMNVVTDAHGAVESNIDREHKLALAPPPPPPPFSQGSPESVVAGILLGPFASPVLGVVSSAIGSIFGF